MGGHFNVLWLCMTLHWSFKWSEQFICKFRNSLKKQKLTLKLIDLMESRGGGSNLKKMRQRLLPCLTLKT